jgi:manganese transport protein
MFSLPKTATAPFCPAEVRGVVAVPPGLSTWQKMLRFAGPGLLISVGYMDPGNWATDIEAGSRYGASLLFVVVLSSLAAIVLQTLSLRLGVVTGKDLARMSRDSFRPRTVKAQWVLAELAIIACDIAEVLGCALAFKMLLGVPLWLGVLLTGFDTLIVLGLKGKGFRSLEAIILALVTTIGLCFVGQLILVKPDAGEVARGLIPSLDALKNQNALYLAIGILGATIMPHNLYLHSSIVQTRVVSDTEPAKREAIKLATFDVVGSLFIALFINAAILVLAASAFHRAGATEIAGIEEAHRLLEPIAGTALAGLLFGVALLASGQSSTFTGTIAGQVIMEGFLDLSIPCWQRRLITRGLALIPAMIGVLTLGEHSVGRMLVLTQVVLSAQLPFAIWPLLRFTDNPALMGQFANGLITRVVAWFLFAVISAANVWLVVRTLMG